MSVKKKFASVTDIHVKTTTILQCLRITATELLLGIISIYYDTYHYTFLHILFTTILLSFIIYQNKNVNNNYMQFYY